MKSYQQAKLTLLLVLLGGIVYVAAPQHLVAAQAYYISSTSGNDHNDGQSPKTAWRNLSTIYLKSVSKHDFQPGDKILLKRGDRWDDQIRMQANGTVQYPILIDAYGDGEKPLLYGENHRIEWESVAGHQGVFTTDLGDESVIGFVFLNGKKLELIAPSGILKRKSDLESFLSKLQAGELAGKFGSRVWVRTGDNKPPDETLHIFRVAGVLLADSSNIQIENLDIQHFYTGIDVTDSRQVLVHHNDIQNVLGIGIYLRSGDVNCRVESNTVFRTGNTALYVLKGVGNTFRDNWVSHVEPEILGINVRGDGMGVGLQRSQQTLVEYNYFTHSGGMDFYYEQNSVVRYNYLYHVRSAGAPHGVDLKVYGNIYNLGEPEGKRGSTGINAVATGPGTIAVFNNTIFNASKFFLMGSSDKGGNVVFSDNIVFSSVPGNTMAVFGENVASNHNCFSTPDRPVFRYKKANFWSLESYQAKSGLDKDSVFYDPRFFSSTPLTPLDFHSSATSGCSLAAFNTPFADLTHASTYDHPHIISGDPVIGALRTDKKTVQSAPREQVCKVHCFQHTFAVPVGVYLVRLKFSPSALSEQHPEFTFSLNGRKVVADFLPSETIGSDDSLLRSFLVRTNVTSIVLEPGTKTDTSVVNEVDIITFDTSHGDGPQVVSW